MGKFESKIFGGGLLIQQLTEFTNHNTVPSSLKFSEMIGDPTGHFPNRAFASKTLKTNQYLVTFLCPFNENLFALNK
jgi:hypothetical protein